MYKEISLEKIKLDLINLGVTKGDTLFITADLMKVGYSRKGRKNIYSDWVKVFNEVLGEEGTFMTVSFSKSYPLFSFDKQKPFDNKVSTDSGALSKALLDNENSIRSSHPTNSYVAVGKNAEFLTKDHNEKSFSYDPTKKMLDLGGKNLMLGTIDEKNAPMVFHYVQQLLGYTLKDPLSGLTGCFYKDTEGNLRRFIRKDLGGCSAAGHKLYSHFSENGCISLGKVGKAESALIDMRKSFKVCLKIMESNPQFSMCEDKSCISCYGKYANTGIYSFYVMLNYFLKYLFK